MSSAEFDLSAFEDPAPSSLSKGELEASLPVPKDTVPVPRQRLALKADIQLEGNKYKGRRVSRSDVELDHETLGLLNDSDSGKEPNNGTSDASESELDESDDNRSVDNGQSTSDDVFDISSIPDDASDVGQKRKKNQLETQERKVAKRLANAEAKEAIRAAAIRNQKAIYDVAVDLRIKLEPLMNLARSFPGSEQRSACTAWSDVEGLADCSKETECSLDRLLAAAEKAWVACWGTHEGEVNDSSFDDWRNVALENWSRKVDQATGVVPKGGFKTLNTSVVSQMKASLASGKHIARTRRVKEVISLVGGLQMEEGGNNIHYDDGEMYRGLLREIIENGDAPGGGLRYAKLSKGGREKRKRDGSFAKGKRIKYDVHEKLVGFLAPLPMQDYGPLDEIVASLLGKQGRVNGNV